jgi:5-methylcytosine-specific restriction protein A
MARTVALWIGKTDDSVPPPRVYDRVFDTCKGNCHRCGRPIRRADKWTLEHRIAIILGGRNAEDNLCLTCEWCLPVKNAEDQSAKSKLANIRKRDRGIRTTSRPMPGSRASGWKKPMNGPAVRR